MNLTVSRLLHGVDVMLGMTWLKAADPIIRWSTRQVYIPDSISSLQRIMGQWLDKQVKTGTVKVLSTNEELESLKQPSKTASLEILKSPAVLGREEIRDAELLEEFSRQGGCIGDYKIFRI